MNNYKKQQDIMVDKKAGYKVYTKFGKMKPTSSIQSESSETAWFLRKQEIRNITEIAARAREMMSHAHLDRASCLLLCKEAFQVATKYCNTTTI